MTDQLASSDAEVLSPPPPADSLAAPSLAESSGPSEPVPEGPAASQAANLAATQELARRLVALREERGWSQTSLAALTKDVEVDSIKGYEKALYRPQRGALWQLAQAFDIMPISLGHSSTRSDAPVPYEQQLLRRGNRPVRVQQLAVLLGEGRVSLLAKRSGLDIKEWYNLAMSESKLTEAQLEPVFRALPQVQRPWLLDAEGQALGLVPEVEPVTASPRPEGTETTVLSVTAAPGPVAWPRPEPTPPLAATERPQLLRLPMSGGPVSYVPLGAGLVAEVSTVAAGERTGISQVRLLAGAGEMPVLTERTQLDALYGYLLTLLPFSPDPADPTN